MTTQARRPAAKAAKPARPRRTVEAETEPTPDDQVVTGEVIDQGQPDDTEPPTGLRNKDGSPLKTSTVEAAGRTFTVSMPDEAKLAIMRRFANRYGDVKGEVSLEQGIAMTDAAISTIQAILENQADKDWIETALLSGEVKLADLQPIVDRGMQNLVDANSNRQQRRAADHGPKAKRAALAAPQ